MLYSVKMRSSLGGTHGKGGRHISGAERIVSEDLVDETVISMMRRAREHERGWRGFHSGEGGRGAGCGGFVLPDASALPDRHEREVRGTQGSGG